MFSDVPYICPYCNSKNCVFYKKYNTLKNGERKLYKCKDCRKTFSETKWTFMEWMRESLSSIALVLKARSNGMGLNASCETFNVAKNTLIDWEKKFSELKEVLWIYSLVHTFVSQTIEGDELYTKVNKNVPIEDCIGWTILLMERASRFIWEVSCWKKDRKLFLKALKKLKKIIRQTEDLTLITDGERRYGNILFEICSKVVYSGKQGRPKKVLPKGVKVRLKNKGSKSHKKGPKRSKYEAPQAEHPETVQNITNTDIHANHVEATNASIRRRISAFRRKTNTYAKKKSALQRVLDGYWIVNNFIRKHFTTKQVPAVALWIVKEWFSWVQILMLPKHSLMANS